MKNSIIVTALILVNSVTCFCQGVLPAPDNKSVVYFVRKAGTGELINFSYFDSAKLIGKFNGPKYIRYECEPGTHLFWARSENKDFIEAEVEAGKIYFIEAIPKMGVIKAQVKLSPVDPKDLKRMKKILKFVNENRSESFTVEELENDARNLKDVIEKGLANYKEEKAAGKKYEHLEKTMYYNTQ